MAAATRSPGRCAFVAGQEADERDIRNKTKGRRYCRDSPRDFPRVDHRPGDPHVPVPALQYPLRLDEGDSAGRRLSVRVEIFVWLQPLLDTFFASNILRPDSGWLFAAARRRGGVPTAEGHRCRLHQTR